MYAINDLLMMTMNLIDIAILNNECSDYHCIVSRISKMEAIKNKIPKYWFDWKKWNIINIKSKSWICKFTSNSNLNEKKWETIN